MSQESELARKSRKLVVDLGAWLVKQEEKLHFLPPWRLGKNGLIWLLCC